MHAGDRTGRPLLVSATLSSGRLAQSGQSASLTPKMSGVRVTHRPPKCHARNDPQGSPNRGHWHPFTRGRPGGLAARIRGPSALCVARHVSSDLTMAGTFCARGCGTPRQPSSASSLVRPGSRSAPACSAARGSLLTDAASPCGTHVPASQRGPHDLRCAAPGDDGAPVQRRGSAYRILRLEP